MPPRSIVVPITNPPGDAFPPLEAGSPYSRNKPRFRIPAQFDPVNVPNDQIPGLVDATYWTFTLPDPKDLGGFTGVTVKRLNAREGLEVTLSTSRSSAVREIEVDALVGRVIYDPRESGGEGIVFEDGSIAKVVYSGESYISGGDKHDFLYGGNGSETLNGRGSSDYMKGGGGNDTYIVDNAADFIEESVATGIETVKASVTWSLSQNTQDRNGLIPTPEIVATGIDNLILTGNGDIDGTGNDLNNSITGNNANNSLVGELGNDILIGNNGNDLLNGYGTTVTSKGQVDNLDGGAGNDLFILGGSWGVSYVGQGRAIITGWNAAEDKIQLYGSAEQYELDKTRSVVGTSAVDTEIFYIGGGGRERIGVVQDMIDVDTAQSFVFV